MSKVAMPQMKKFNNNATLAAGTIAAGGTLGIMIPPIGMNALVVTSVRPRVALGDILRGIVPYLFALVAGLILSFFILGIATRIPSLIR